MSNKKIYLASSWKNSCLVIHTRELLVDNGYEVDAFCDPNCSRFVFDFNDLGNISKEDNISIRKHKQVQKAFKEDKKWLDWCNTCIMLLPCGISAHLEAGYAKGCGKKLIIFAPLGFKLGDVDVMYGFADYITESYPELFEYLEQ